MLNVANATTNNDDISNMLASARRQASAAPEEDDLLEGLYYRGMSRRKSLAQDILVDAFALPPTPSDSDDDTTTSDDSSDDVSEDEVTQEKPEGQKRLYASRTSVRVLSSDNNSRVYESAAKKRSTRKISFLKTRSTSQSLINPKNASSRFRRMGRRLSLTNLMSPAQEEGEEDATEKKDFGRVKSRRTSLPVIRLIAASREVPKSEPIHENIIASSKSVEQEDRKKSGRKFKKSRKKVERTYSSESEENSKQRFSDSHSGSQDFPFSSGTRTDDELSGQDFDEEESGRMNVRINDGSDSNECDSTNNDKRRKSVKDVFKKSFFASKKSKKKNSLSNASGSSNQDQIPAREYKRRASRLEMGIPIEEVFAGVEFKMIEKSKSTDKSSDDENDVIDDVDASFKSMNNEDQERKISTDFDSVQERLGNNSTSLASKNNDFELKNELETYTN